MFQDLVSLCKKCATPSEEMKKFKKYYYKLYMKRVPTGCTCESFEEVCDLQNGCGALNCHIFIMLVKTVYDKNVKVNSTNACLSVRIFSLKNPCMHIINTCKSVYCRPLQKYFAAVAAIAESFSILEC